MITRGTDTLFKHCGEPPTTATTLDPSVIHWDVPREVFYECTSVHRGGGVFILYIVKDQSAPQTAALPLDAMSPLRRAKQRPERQVSYHDSDVTGGGGGGGGGAL